MADGEPAVLRCSFCNKSQRDVRKLVAGPAVCICDECVDVCNEILDQDGIPAGRGPKAGARAVAHAGEYLQMARDLASTGNFVGAAREVRNAALETLRGAALVDGESATQWSETKVVLEALHGDPEIARLLQVQDEAHIILRVSIDSAELTARDIACAIEVVTVLTETLRQKVATSENVRPRRGAQGLPAVDQ